MSTLDHSPPPQQRPASQDREDFREHLRELLADVAPPRRTLDRMEVGALDDRAWRRLTSEMQITGLRIPEERGGGGFGLREVGVALEELGRVVYPGPVLATTLAVEALLLTEPSDARHEALRRVAEDGVPAALALAEPGRGWALEPQDVTPTRTGASWTLTGRKAWVVQAADAAILVVSAQVDGEAQLFLVDADAPGIHFDAVPTQDLTRPLSHITFTATPALALGGADRLVDELFSRMLALLACEQAGGTEACVELAVEHARERVQFGQPIGAFQAVRHRCADMFVAAETAKAAAWHAIEELDDGAPDRHTMAGIAASHCADAYVANAASCIQVLGGIGFTWEHPAHLYLKRAKSSALLFGDSSDHRARIASDLVSLYTGSRTEAA
jgi:alkylation response protein AidB-like acyl-CoA dehydrogenase